MAGTALTRSRRCSVVNESQSYSPAASERPLKKLQGRAVAPFANGGIRQKRHKGLMILYRVLSFHLAISSIMRQQYVRAGTMNNEQEENTNMYS